MAKEDFNIDAKLRITGLETPGKFDGGVVKFSVDTTEFRKAVDEASKAADLIQKRLSNIEINRINIRLDPGNLLKIESEIKNAIQSASANINIAPNIQIPKSAMSQVRQLQELTKRGDNERIQSIQKLQREVDELLKKEAGLGRGGGGFGIGGGGGGGAGGSFGATPPGGMNFNQAASSASKLALVLEDIHRNADRATNSMVDLEQLSFEVGRKAAVFRGMAIAINTVVDATQAAAQFLVKFNDSLLELNKILQQNKTTLSITGNEIFTLAQNTGVAVEDTVNIATEFARAGLNARGYGTILQLTEQALIGVQGTSLNAAQSTKTLITTIQQVESGARGLSKELVTTTKLFDILGKAEDITASQATDVTEALNRSAASVFATGASFEEVASLISVLQERTQRGGDVIGTALKTLASRIGSSSSEASQALKSIGVETIDAQGKLRNIFDVLRDTAGAFKGLSEAEQADVAVKAAGIRQVEIFRAALLDFNRVLEVQQVLQGASGDAQRKAAIEQEKFATILNKTKIALQDIAKTAGEGLLGQSFAFVLESLNALITGFSSLNKMLGGAPSGFLGFIAAFTAFKALKPIVSGIIQTFRFFVSSQGEAKTNFESMNIAAQQVGDVGIARMNNALRTTATIMQSLNQEMNKLTAETEAAALRAEKFKKVRELAERSTSSADLLGGRSIIDRRAQEILDKNRQQIVRQQQDLRSQAMVSIIGQGKGRDLVTAAKQTPGLFSQDELKRIKNLEASLNDSAAQAGKFSGSLVGVNNMIKGIISNTVVWGLALSAGSGALSGAAENLRRDGSKLTAGLADVGSSILKFAGPGLFLGGGFGAAIGGLIGTVVGLFEVMNKNTKTVEELQNKYLRLGVVQAKNGQITSEIADQIDKAFKNIERLKGLEVKLNVGEFEKANTEVNKLSKNLLTIFNPNETKDIQRQQILGGVGQIQSKLVGGEGIDLADLTLLNKQSSALKEIGPKTLESIIEAFEVAAPDVETANEIRTRAEEILSSVAESLKGDKLRAARDGLNKGQNEFAKDLEQLLPDNLLGNNPAIREALSKFAQGLFDADTTSLIEKARSDVRKGSVMGVGGTRIGNLAFDTLASRAKSLGDEFVKLKNDVRLGSAGKALPDILSTLPDILAKGLEDAQARQSTERRQNLLSQQTGAFTSLNREFLDFGSAFDTPISKLEILLRDFTDDLGKEVIRLQEATLRAITPQKELANAMTNFAGQRLQDVKAQRDLTQADALTKLLREIQQLPGGERKIGFDEQGRRVAGFSDTEANRTVGEERRRLTQALLDTSQAIRERGISDPREQRSLLGERLSGADLKTALPDEELKDITDAILKFNKSLMGLDIQVLEDTSKFNTAQVNSLREILKEQEKSLTNNAKRKDILTLDAKAAIESLTSIRKIIAERQLEATISENTISSTNERLKLLDSLIATEQRALQVDANNIASKDKLAILEEERTKESIELEEQLGKARSASLRSALAAAKEVIDITKQESDLVRSEIDSRARINDLLTIGRSEIEKFNDRLNQNTDSFKATSAAFAAEIQVINQTISNQEEKEARLKDVRNRVVQATLEAAQAEAQIISERREALKQLSEEALRNIDEQKQAQKAIIDANKALTDSYFQYQDAVQSAISASSQYNLQIALARVESDKLTGKFTGVKDQITALVKEFNNAEQAALEVGAGEKIIVELRRQSIAEQINLFNELLQTQSALARSFFQSSAEDQSKIFQGIQEAQAIANLLGGSFDKFKMMGEGAINALGSQLLALPQEVRQRVIQSLETLQKLGGAQVGGFTADQLLTAIETSALGVSTDGLEVDPLFKVQERIAQLGELQAQLATDQLIAANEQVVNSKQQLEISQAQKDLAEIQLTRLQEEGGQIQGKIAEMRGNLATILLKQDETNRTGFINLNIAINKVNETLLTSLPDAFSSRIGQVFRDSAGGVDLRTAGSNAAMQNKIANQSGFAPSVISNAFGNAQQQPSNLPSTDSAEATNRRLEDIVNELKSLNVTSTESNTAIQELVASSQTTVAPAVAEPTPDININIEGQQTVTVTGFESAIASIVRNLSEQFSFVTEAEAREIANQVFEVVRTELQRRGILKVNQL